MGVRFAKGLAVTGIAMAKVAWIALAGIVALIAGVMTLGRGHRLVAGRTLETGEGPRMS
ncbi:MAG TPA: hypothetical protein VM841_14045 [Actinomycetota bacterium]|nr:hypothetical protein [Actinomycetota bacterium]